ncbi:putative quinol monooxygenase [Rhodococcus aerolatus]
MIFIVVKFPVKPEHADTWLDRVADFTTAVRAEPGNVFFDWARSTDDPNEYWLTEGFVDDAAGKAHVEAPHFAAAIDTMSEAVSATPKIVSTSVDQPDWGEMGEVSPR